MRLRSQRILLAVCLCVVAFIPESSEYVTMSSSGSVPARPVYPTAKSVEVWFSVQGQADAPAVIELEPAQVQRREGTLGAQAPQEVAYYDPDSIEGLICSVFTESCDKAVAVARCESGLNPSARNRSGASGLFQIMLPTHAGRFEAHGWDASEWSDPYKNTVVAHDIWSSSGWRPWSCA